MQRIKKLFLAPFTWSLALLFLVEEWLWDASAKLMARLAVLRYVNALEQRIAALPARWALLAFLLPSTILIPAKLIGLHAITSGHWLIGTATFITAKLVGMALFSRIFNLTRPALMQLLWFVKVYEFVMRYRNRIHDYLAQWQAYQAIKTRIQAVLQKLRT
jgi:hypothetical protein